MPLHFVALNIWAVVSKMCTSHSWHLLFLGAVVLCNGVLVGSVYTTTSFSQGSPWPSPASITTTTESQPVDAMQFRFNTTGHNCDILEAAFIRYISIIFHGKPYYKEHSGVDVSRVEKHNGPQFLFQPKMSDGGLKSLDVALKNECETWPSLEMDESCELSICCCFTQAY